MIETLNPQARPYAAAILSVGTAEPNAMERAIVLALDLDQVEHRHIAFSGYCRRLAAGEREQDLQGYLVAAFEAGELHHAWAAVGWLRVQGLAQSAMHTAMDAGPRH